MAEGIFEGVLGGEIDSPETEGKGEARAGADAFAAALAADHAKYDPAVAKSAKRFLDKQSRFLDAQTEELIEQRRLRLDHLHDQTRDGHLRRLSQRIRIGTQVAFAMIAAAIALGLMVMVADAFSARSVVVEPFDAPPALAARGLTGKVVAGGVLDALTRLQAATRASAEQRQLADAWTSDIKVEVPETGISIGDIDRLLKARFGHDIHIEGDLIETEVGGLALTIRGDGVLPRTFQDGAGELDKLTTQAAEYVYGRSQPALYETYLLNAGRSPEAVSFAKGAFATASAADRPYLLNTWANALLFTGSPVTEAAPIYENAIRLKPDFWIGYTNLMNVRMVLGDEEGAWRIGQTMRRIASGRPGRAPETAYNNADLLAWNLLADRNITMSDILAHGGIGTGVTAEAPQVADLDARLHDPVDAELQLQTAQADASDPSVAALTHFVHGRLAAEAGDTPRAAAELEAFVTAFANPAIAGNYPGYPCWAAPAEEAAGHPDKADAALKAGGHFVDCYRFRADILDHRGDWAGAQKAYAEAVALAPDLPAAYYSWGVALARHGDLAGAETKLAIAHEKGPGWADPLKARGDILASRGRWREALGDYDAALRLAPAWPALHQAREAAARRAG